MVDILKFTLSVLFDFSAPWFVIYYLLPSFFCGAIFILKSFIEASKDLTDRTYYRDKNNFRGSYVPRLTVGLILFRVIAAFTPILNIVSASMLISSCILAPFLISIVYKFLKTPIIKPERSK